MRATLVEERHVHIQCPRCADASGLTVTHLLGQSRAFGPWYCNHCGHAITGTTFPDGTVDIELSDKVLEKRWDVLVIPPDSEPIYFVVEGFNIIQRTGDLLESKPYYYESHTCPTNWLPHVEEVIVEGEPDPHGLWKFVKSVPYDPGGIHSDTPLETWEAILGMSLHEDDADRL